MRLTLAAASLASASALNAWSIVAPNLLSEATGIALASDKVAFVAGGANGAGAGVLKTIDGGKTWANTADQTALIFLDVTAYGNNVAASSIFGEQFSTDGGNTFKTSGGGAEAAQCIRNIGPATAPLGFAAVGQVGGIFNQSQGVAVSLNGGANFTSYAIPSDIIRTEVRYGAFVTPNVWYITAGQWPASNNDDTESEPAAPAAGTTKVRSLTERRNLVVTTSAEGVVSAKHEVLPSAKSVLPKGAGALRGRSLQQAPNNSYAAQLLKTTNGGESWSSLYYSQAMGYFNGIDCVNPTNCCAVSECDDGPNAGAYIVCTYDGGAHWSTVLSNTTAGMSLLDIRTVGTNGYWAVGGVLSDFGPVSSTFYYSGDGGKTFTLDSEIPGTYVTAVDCNVGSSVCMATVVDAAQTASIAYASAV